MRASTLRAIRAKLDMTLPDFGRKVGYGQQSIGEMERLVRPIPPTLALAVLALDAGIVDQEPSDYVRVLNGD